MVKWICFPKANVAWSKYCIYKAFVFSFFLFTQKDYEPAFIKKYKTTLCAHYPNCLNEENCRYAHGKEEQRVFCEVQECLTIYYDKAKVIFRKSYFENFLLFYTDTVSVNTIFCCRLRRWITMNSAKTSNVLCGYVYC